MDTNHEEQPFAPGQILEALQTAPSCRPTAPNCKARGEAEDIPFPDTSFILKEKKTYCSQDLVPTFFEVFDFKQIWEIQTEKLPYWHLQDITRPLAAGMISLEELLSTPAAGLETWTPFARIWSLNTLYYPKNTRKHLAILP